jgi:cytochrome c-type biogenesis protein CcmH/NrfF
MRDVSNYDVERLYRSVADGEPRREILQIMYDLFGKSHQLRPPVDEIRLAERCQPGKHAHG